MELSQDCVFQSLAIMDQLSFARSMSEGVCKLCSSWNFLLKKTKHSSLIFLFGAAGGILYFWKRRKKKEDMSLRLHNQPKCSILESFFERLSLDEFVEDDMLECCQSDNHECYVRPGLEYEHDSFNDKKGVHDLRCDLPLHVNIKYKSEIIEGSHISNSCSKCQKWSSKLKNHQQRKASSKPSEKYSESPVSNTKTSTPELSTSSEELKSQRLTAPKRVGHHLRTDVPGSEGVAQ